MCYIKAVEIINVGKMLVYLYRSKGTSLSIPEMVYREIGNEKTFPFLPFQIP